MIHRHIRRDFLLNTIVLVLSTFGSFAIAEVFARALGFHGSTSLKFRTRFWLMMRC